MITFFAGCAVLVVTCVAFIAIMLTAFHLGFQSVEKKIEKAARAEREASAVAFDKHWEQAARTVAEVKKP